MNDDDESAEFLPPEYLAHYRLNPPEPVWMPTPLPALAAAHYVSGGCWSLALALHEQTGGLPFELDVRGGMPRHCYVLDDETALDAMGRRLLRYARAGSERTQRLDEAQELLAILYALEPIGTKLVEETERPEVKACAERAAAYILSKVGWQAPAK
jgi:hypothetical protein